MGNIYESIKFLMINAIQIKLPFGSRKCPVAQISSADFVTEFTTPSIANVELAETSAVVVCPKCRSGLIVVIRY